jgi:alpha-1,2-mannosyltransferase
LAHRYRYRVMVIVGCAIVIAIQAIVIFHRRSLHPDDLDVAREFGRRFIAREDIYRNGLQYPYMPAAAMFFAPLAMVPAAVAFGIRYAIALASLFLTLVLLYRMVAPFSSRFAEYGFETATLTLLLAGHYVIRDLDDAGLHILILAMIVAGIYSAWRGNIVLSGVAIALAIAIKVTPGLFIPFMIWKRKWKLALVCAIATLIWTALPMLWLGPSLWAHFQLQWMRVAIGQAFGGIAAVAAGTEQEFQNQSLRAAVVFYLTRGSILNAQSALNEAARHPFAEVAATLIELGLIVLCMWRGRAPYHGDDDRQWLIESSAVLILILLLSPVTWTQHMVFLIPGVYLIVAEAVGRETQRALILGAITAYTLFSLILTREVVGRAHYTVLLAYHTQTLCMLIVLGLVVTICPTTTTGLIKARRERGMAARSA